jgi:hypothetical protein
MRPGIGLARRPLDATVASPRLGSFTTTLCMPSLDVARLPQVDTAPEVVSAATACYACADQGNGGDNGPDGGQNDVRADALVGCAKNVTLPFLSGRDW